MEPTASDRSNQNWLKSLSLPSLASFTLGAASLLSAAENTADDTGIAPPVEPPPAVKTIETEASTQILREPAPSFGEVDFSFDTETTEAATDGTQLVPETTELETNENEEATPTNPESNNQGSDQTGGPTNTEVEAQGETPATQTIQTETAPASAESVENDPSATAPEQENTAESTLETVATEEELRTQAEARPETPTPAASVAQDPAPATDSAASPNRVNQARDFGIALATIGLGILSVAAAIRGVVKGSIEVSLWRKSINRFNRREFTDMIALNAYSLTPVGDHYVLQADTKDRPLLTEFLGGNRGARNYFVKAAKHCTHQQPLVPLEFPRDYEENWISKGLMRAITKPAYYVSFKKLFKKLHEGPLPEEERFAGLNRINKLLREAVSASYNGAGSGVLAKQFQKELPLKYYEKVLYVIPTCSVGGPDRKHSRALSVITIGKEDFERFGDPEEVAKIKPAAELEGWHVRLLQRAYAEYQSYKSYTNRVGKEQELFPRVRVFVAYYDTDTKTEIEHSDES